jgi:hypothetical protein
MKIHALATVCLLASASTAMADNRVVWSPVTKVIDAQLTNTIDVKECCDELRMLRFQNGSGATYVYAVTLVHENGSRERIDVGRWIYPAQPMIAVDVPDRRAGVNRIVVNTWTWFPSTYQLFAKHVERAALPPPPPPAPPQRLVIGKDVTFAKTAGYVQLPVGAAKGAFAKLHVEGVGPVTYLGTIYVTFANGKTQAFAVDKPLRRNEDLVLDLSGDRRQIRSVTLMAGDDLRYIGHASSRFSVDLR